VVRDSLRSSASARVDGKTHSGLELSSDCLHGATPYRAGDTPRSRGLRRQCDERTHIEERLALAHIEDSTTRKVVLLIEA